MKTIIEQEKWENAKRYVQQLTDKLGMPVDEEIVETVAILQLMGITTTMSCSGHLDRITGGPYVMFVSPKAEEYRKKCQEIGNPASSEYKKLYKKALRETLLDQQELYHALEDFYTSRVVSFGQRLVLRTVGFDTSRLYCQGAEFIQISNPLERKRMLAENQSEMRDFTDHLKRNILDS